MKPLVRMAVILLLAVSAFALAHPSAAQSGDSDCSPEALSASIDAVQELLAAAQAAASDGDTASALVLVNEANEALAQIQVPCGTAALPTATSLLCDSYPQYCVPLVGGGPDEEGLALVEAPEVRNLDTVANTAGVVRGMTADWALFIGNPDAPIHFLEVLDFACPHCLDYHETTVGHFLQEAVLSGQASFQIRLLAFVAGPYSVNAAHAMLCAGEQGAAWEMYDELFLRVKVEGASSAFALEALAATADELGLDGAGLQSCVSSGRYDDLLAAYSRFSTEHGVTGTPTVLVSYGDSGEWEKVENRSLENLLALVTAAN